MLARQRNAFVELFGGHARPHDDDAAVDQHRHVDPASRRVLDRECLALPGLLEVRIGGRVRPGRAQKAAVGEDDAGLSGRASQAGLQHAGQPGTSCRLETSTATVLAC